MIEAFLILVGVFLIAAVIVIFELVRAIVDRLGR